MSQLQLLTHTEAQEMAFRKLEHQPAQPAALPSREGLPFPQDGASGGLGQAADHLEQGGFAAAAAARHQPQRSALKPQLDAIKHGAGGGGRLVANSL